MQPEELERRRRHLHRLLALLPVVERRPVESVAAEGSPAVNGMPATWTYYPRPEGGYGIGQVPERAFIESVRVPDIPAVMDWVWRRVAHDFVDRHVMRPTGARHHEDPLFLSIRCPRSERADVKAAIDASTEDLGALADSGSRWARAAVAARPDADPELLASIARHVAMGSLGWLRSPLDPDSADGGALRNVLTNPATPQAVLARHAKPRSSAELWITQAVASNPSTHGEVLVRLAAHAEPAIRWTVAGNSAAPPSAVVGLGRDSDQVMRWFLARHHAVERGVLGDWMTDPLVVTCAAAGPNAGVVATSGPALEADARVAVARNPSTPAEVLATWAGSVDPADTRLAYALAANPSTPVAVCRTLIDLVGAGAVATALLRRADLTPELMDAVLAGDRSWAVPDAAVAAMSMPQPRLPEGARSRLLGEDDDLLRGFVARSSHLDPEVVRRLVRDPATSVRLELARNRSVPTDLLAPLADDADPSVASAARRRLQP